MVRGDRVFFVAFCLAFAGPFFDAICDTSVQMRRRSLIACSGRLRLALFRRVFTLKMDRRLKCSIFVTRILTLFDVKPPISVAFDTYLTVDFVAI